VCFEKRNGPTVLGGITKLKHLRVKGKRDLRVITVVRREMLQAQAGQSLANSLREVSGWSSPWCNRSRRKTKGRPFPAALQALNEKTPKTLSKTLQIRKEFHVRLRDACGRQRRKAEHSQLENPAFSLSDFA
jgi:hypothetical protein